MSLVTLRTQLLRRKPLEEIEEDTPADERLAKSLGLWQLTAIGVGGIIGAGVFSLAGSVAHSVTGPAVLISFLIAGIASAAAALCYAEFAGMIPKAGSAYTYGYVALGEIVGWFIGWDLLLEYVAVAAVVAIGVSGYFRFLLEQIGISLPDWMMGALGTGDGHVFDVFAALFCLGTAWVLSRGIKSVGRFETVAVAIKVALVVLIIVLGVFHIDSANYTPYFPFGTAAVMTGAATVFFAVFGYDAMSTAAEESKEAKKHLPKAILYSLGIAMALYVLATLVLTGMQKYTEISPDSGFSTAFESVGMPGVANIIAVGAIVGIITVVLTFMLGVTRVWFAMSRDGLLPEWFAKTHPVRKVPTRVTWIVGVGSALMAGFLPINTVAELTNIGILSAFIVVCIAVAVLRHTRPEVPRSFRLPFMPVVPIIGVVFSGWLILSLPWETWLRFGIWLILGLFVYFFYSRTHSKLESSEPVSPAS
ncbi:MULTISPECIES: amino acid permease [Rhodococcus]|uniref:Amino acid permease n=1 Tax=Rhodococcus oxybenzonivorans TaxID=1990687 RepID=A0AAE4UXM9_9NOCA|nr:MULTISPECIES: amino acid permease [Rhodococcus]MDV7242018.1 amino acid permease [Rhodococcus oxybenzonivorans]MDV7264945.1 amino acid permease [Rhodococcus oxybenzonivorans]MDV7277718.1 amino acid permease [Rhodococcus oxybenzonivorans]MDV7334300.1 amino acid permease [Rhodococcus oxybenzonivorans]MDV7343719.1 amino acid permease [Rhodococcus oxybenzonivorans]